MANKVVNQSDDKIVVHFNHELNTEQAQNEKESFKTIISLFEDQVKTHPFKSAAVWKNQTITYDELNRKANKLGNKLKKMAIGEGSIVGIFADQSVEFLVGVLGALKVGATYVPIDPFYPLERIHYILEDAQPEVILQCNIKGAYQKDIFSIDLKELDKSQENDANLSSLSDVDERLTYIIYTSGTTGKPKGVLIKEQSVMNHIETVFQVFFEEKPGCTPLFTSTCFDFSIPSYLAPLAFGGTVFIVSDMIRRFEEILAHQSFDVIKITPTLWSNLKLPKDGSLFNKVKSIVFGGEVLSQQVVKEVFQVFGENCTIYNEYGPTEATVFTTVNKITKKTDTINIGSSIKNAEIYIINRLGKLCEAGEIGEICIAGVGIAKGYLNQPELTREKFVENPYGEGKLYRSGDLGKWTESGTIDYLSRIDDQVKIRGYRVELSEIETTLYEMKEIEKTAVLVVEETEELIAFIVPNTKVDCNKLKKQLRNSLPTYMVPAKIIAVEGLPYNANGKLDRQLLLENEQIEVKEFKEAKTEMEANLVQLFKEILEIETVSTQESFFDLGGRSLNVLVLLNKLKASLGVSLTYQTLFENASVSELAAILEGEKLNKYETIDKVRTKKYYPMSSAQKQLYALNKRNEQDVAYNTPLLFEITGVIDRIKFKNALVSLVNRHEILRTTFYTKNGDFLQKIHDFIPCEIDSLSVIRSSLQTLLSELTEPFDLEKGPLFRFKWIEMEHKQYLFWDVHHIIFDSISREIFIKEFERLYNNETLSETQLSYIDYCGWSLEKNNDIQETYWLKEASDLSILEFPLDFERSNSLDFSGKSMNKVISKRINKKVRKLAKETGTTEYMIFLSVLMLLLYQYTGQKDIAIGSPMSGRIKNELQEMLGMLTNTVLIREKIKDKNQSYLDFLYGIKGKVLSAMDYQDYPFDQFVEKLGCPVAENRNPLFDIVFTVTKRNLIGLKGESFHTSLKEKAPSGKFDLTIDVELDDTHSYLKIDYREKLFKESTINQFLEHYICLLTQIVESPQQVIAEYSAVSKKEQENILSLNPEIKDNKITFNSLNEAFKNQVLHSKDQIAISDKGKELTYTELDFHSDQVAFKLQESTIRVGDKVALLADHNVETIIGLLGIIKAGATYVPIDPKYPKDRIDYILADSKAKLILTQKLIQEITEKPAGSQALIQGTLAEKPQLAYIIYTSGTTGAPKGVMINHHNVLNLALNPNYMENDRKCLIQIGSLAFDAATFEIWSTLLNGGQLHFVENDEFLNPKKLQQVISDKKVDTLFLTTALFNHLVGLDPTIFDSLVTLFTGGEKISVYHVNKLLNHNPLVELKHMYGPTETTTFATHYSICDEDVKSDNQRSIPIGKPIQNTTVYVMNDDQLCGFNMVGELCIGGLGVSEGYFNHENLTTEKFKDNPFGPGKIYHTGDFVRMDQDGNLYYLGRSDDQVKIRGYRVEIQEIQETINQHEMVHGSSVQVRKIENGEQFLCAYIVKDDQFSCQQLKEELHRQLPNYMVPNYFIPLEVLPRTQNGKIDLNQLSQIELPQQEYKEPITVIQKKIASVFEEVLRQPKIGLEDNFFELGGNSLNGTHLISLLNTQFNFKITLKQLFMNPTVAVLAQKITHECEESVIIEATDREFYEMTDAQKRLYSLQQTDDTGIAYNMPLCFKVEGNIDEQKATKSLNQLIAAHQSLRTSFQIVDGKFVQRVKELAIVDFKIILDEKIEQAFDSFVQPFDLAKGSLIRGGIVKNNKGNWFLLDVHHIVSDGKSTELMIKEFEKYYNGDSVSALEFQFKDYSEWLKSKNFKQEHDYWLTMFEQPLPELELPYDYSRPTEQSFKGGAKYIPLGKELSQNIKEVLKKEQVTPYMLFLTVTMMLISRYSSSEDVIIGTPMSGRARKEFDKLIGMFVNTVPLRAKPMGNKTFRDFLQEIKLLTLSADEYQLYPFDRLINDLKVTTDNLRNPLFDVFFTYENFEELTLNTFDFKGTKTTREMALGKFDLTFNVHEKEQEYVLRNAYRTALFKEDTVNRIQNHFITILVKCISDVQQKISEIDLVSTLEKEQVLNEFNSTEVEYPDNTLLQLFAERVMKTPSKTAVVYDNAQLSYESLERKSDLLANQLFQSGVRKGDIVGLKVSPSFNMFICAIGIMKAGGVYLPIDIDCPSERTALILKQSRAKMLLSEEKKSGLAIQLMDENSEYSDFSMREIEDVSIVGTDLAYIIYTSGSTGVPKGVMVEHSALSNLIHWHNDYYEITEKDRSIKYAGFGFDASVHEMFPQLIAGCEIHIIQQEIRMDMEKLKAYIEENKITIGFMPTPICEQFMKLETTGLKKMITGGDVLKGKNSAYQLINNYGPSENTVVTTTYKVKPEDNHIPIGKPISNVSVYVLDMFHQLLPIGVVGQLAISGKNLSKGYLHEPALTAEKFIENPFDKNERMYLTGDLVKWNPEGELEYICRNDEQVKIRGNRVELGEIEATLKRLIDVEDCIVLALKDEQDMDRLVAYYTSDHLAYEQKELKNRVSSELPQYMIPNLFIKIPELLYTINNKLDKRNLPKPDFNALKQEYNQPKTSLECDIVKIWEKLLAIKDVGISDNFFEIGGNSLLVTIMHSEINQLLEKPISIGTIFGHPTISELVKEITATQKNSHHLLLELEMKLPVHYRKPQASNKEINHIKIEQENKIKLEELCDKTHLSLSDLLIGFYMLSLSEVMDTQNIKLGYCDKLSRVVPLKINLDKFHNLESLTRKIHIDLSRKQEVYTITSLDQKVTRNNGMIISGIIFSNQENEIEQSIVLNDLLLVIDKNQEGINLEFRFNHDCVNAQLVHDILEFYNNILNLI